MRTTDIAKSVYLFPSCRLTERPAASQGLSNLSPMLAPDSTALKLPKSQAKKSK